MRASAPASSAAGSRARTPALAAVREIFPALDTGEVYLDSASTTQKPRAVIEAVHRYHSAHTANAGRGTYPWASSLTQRIEQVRAAMAEFIGAAPDEVVFTGGATAGLNAVALSWALTNLADGDEILYSPRDHASNIYPWQQLRRLLAGFGRRITLVPYRVTALGEADLEDVAARLSGRTRLIAVSHLHHVFGALTTLEELRGHIDAEVALCFDCSQSGGHLPVRVAELDADFAVFSAHKMFGAPGLGVLYCRRRRHAELMPFLPGGNSAVSLDDSGLRAGPMPQLLEGGTHNIAGILALGAALGVLDDLGLEAVAAHNRALTQRLIAGLRRIAGVEFLPGPAYAPCETGYGIVSFTLAGITATDLGFVLAELGFLVRTGAHCVPAGQRPGDEDSVRVSTHVYNTVEEIDRFTECVATIAEEVS
ncbi:aminotransferase class V-fold PLP-dependent enzyme [Nocardia yunnanensis]|uniref:Aminotransferase class V-fold PLP-dependent enzyme n=1 Tax=Nocardia yunnanensis TaxID=2382165 RepID=A0A386ZFS3_9NOCA|nr:aminotransferase class V-fold PLP-dependent enzyme [Nocardia yunnanensis]AYF75349.1 aminotransferase class V-fold PLP-dependent enzyme [Nocardia yunnanensis]